MIFCCLNFCILSCNSCICIGNIYCMSIYTSFRCETTALGYLMSTPCCCIPWISNDALNFCKFCICIKNFLICVTNKLLFRLMISLKYSLTSINISLGYIPLSFKYFYFFIKNLKLLDFTLFKLIVIHSICCCFCYRCHSISYRIARWYKWW